MAAPSGFSDLRLADLLEAVAARTPAPAGGTVSALAVAMAAALTEMAAAYSADADAARQASALRERLVRLADEDAEAYGEFLRARSGEARERTVEVPLGIAQAAVEVAGLAAGLAETGKPSLRGDALAAAQLAQAGARSAAALVAINLGAQAADERTARARRLAETASAAAERALSSCR